MDRRRMDLRKASELLGVSSEAVRKRVKRGTLDSEKGPDGKLYVWVDDGPDERVPRGTDAGVDNGAGSAMFERMAGEIDFLRRELERKDAIIMTMAQRIPELEAAKPPEQRGSPVPASEHPGGDTDGTPTGHRERSSWWRRFFGL